MPKFGQWTYTVDREATFAAYARSGDGGVDTCECAFCRNFRMVRSTVFPDAFLRLLDELGIDPVKDVEVWECRGDTPGMHLYGGWYHFVGALETSSEVSPERFGEGFEVKLSSARTMRSDVFDGLDTVELSFFAYAVPWGLDEPDPG